MTRSPSWLASGTLLAVAWLAGLAEAATLPPLRVETTDTPVEWTVLHGDTPLLVYRADPRQYKPYVKELRTLRGDNLLRDAPHDHLHHHALMYAVQINGLNFWEEARGNGVQKTVKMPVVELGTNQAGLPRATLRHTLHWLAPQDAFLPDSPALALLIEQRTLELTVDAAREEVALHWHAAFEVGGRINRVSVEGKSYFGLGARFRADLDPVARHVHANGEPDLTGTRQDVSAHDWCAVTFDLPGSPATLAMFGHPDNARGRPTFFAMRQPFAYLSATQALDREPLMYQAGDRFTLNYLVTVYPGVRTAEFLNARAARWHAARP